MNDGLIPSRYAKALYKYAVEQGDQAGVYEEMKQLATSFAAVEGLAKTVDNPFIAATDKKKVLLTAAGAQAGGSLDKFFSLVIKNNRDAYMRLIALAYVKIYREANRIASVEVVTAAEMPSDKVEKIEAVVKNQLGDITLETVHRVDPAIIGGFKVTVDDLELDASVKSELEKLRLKLLN